jgi:tetratricopeptide (TPR) repeat protein
MEYVPGEDLKSMIRMSGQLGLGTAVAIARQICEGLAEAHKRGVVHRDLKSSNIMVDREGTARVMDFGIARSAKIKGITGAGVMIGTPEYMSPEQVEGKEVDARSDIYSLGIILYEMVTGRLPFEGDTPFSVGVKQKSETPHDPRQLNPQVPEELGRLVLRCLEKEKPKRFQRFEDVLSALEGVERKMPTTLREATRHAKPITTREITVKFSLRSVWKPAVVVLGLAAVVFIASRLLTRRGFLPFPMDKPSLAVMYFKNNTGDKNLDHWRRMLSDLLIADLAQSKHVRVMSEDKLAGILERLDQRDAKSYSSTVLKSVGALGGVKHILQGSYAKAGDEFRINVVLLEAQTGEHVGSQSVAGKGEESIFPMVDELTRRIKADFKLSQAEIASDIDREIGKVTTSSPQAYSYYTEGRRYHNSGDYRRSIQLMGKALELDPDFAMAHRSIAVGYGNLALYNEEKKYLQKALELSDRLTDAERFMIQGDFFKNSELTWDKAIEAFEGLLAIYPDSTLANHNLAMIFSDLEEWDKAIEKYEACVRSRTEFVPSYAQLAQVYRSREFYAKARKALEDYIKNFSDNAEIQIELAYTDISRGALRSAEAEVERAIAVDPNNDYAWAARGDLDLCQGDLTSAENIYKKLIGASEPTAYAYGVASLRNLRLLEARFREAEEIMRQALRFSESNGQPRWIRMSANGLANVCVRSGKFDETLKYCQVALEIGEKEESLSAQRLTLYLKARALIGMNDLEGAGKAADALKKVIDQGQNKKAVRFHDHLLGLLELEKKRYAEAIRYFEKALSLAPNGPLAKDADLLESLALAHYQAGDLGKARDVYRQIAALTAGRLENGCVWSRSFYMLGRIHEERGEKAPAIEHYKKFLDLWKGADPGRTEVAEAKTRLAALERN